MKFSSTEQVHRLYDQFRAYIIHEDNLINHRMTWGVTIQSFLIAVYGITCHKILDLFSKSVTPELKYEDYVKIINDNPTSVNLLDTAFFQYYNSSAVSSSISAIIIAFVFVLGLSIIGLFISLSVGRSVYAARAAIDSLKLHWIRIHASSDSHAEAKVLLESLPFIVAGGAPDTVNLKGFATGKFFPSLFTSLWIFCILGALFIGIKTWMLF